MIVKMRLDIFLALLVSCVAGATGVAFSAVKTTNQQHVFGLANQVTFDRNDTNLGDAFNGTIFTVPVSGLYLFTFTGKSKEMSLALTVYHQNGNVEEIRVTEIDSSYASVQFAMSSSSAILELGVGDKVGITLKSGQIINNFNDFWPTETFFTSFSGALLDEPPFSVTAFSGSSLGDYHEEGPISYENVHTNIGSAFDQTTFTAPNSGLYLFTLSGRGTDFRVGLEVNGQERRYIRFLYVKDSPCYYDNSVSNQALLVLDEGDQVQVVNGPDSKIRSSDYQCASSLSDTVTEFSGVLLHELNGTTVQGQEAEEGVVAFSATRSVSLSAGDPDIVEFDIVDLNIGQAFDGVSTFRAPVDGYYLFMFSMMEIYAKVDIFDGKGYKRTLLQAAYSVPEANKRATASTSAILLLSAAQEVFLTSENSFYYDEPTNGTVFSGVLLHKL